MKRLATAFFWASLIALPLTFAHVSAANTNTSETTGSAFAHIYLSGSLDAEGRKWLEKNGYRFDCPTVKSSNKVGICSDKKK